MITTSNINPDEYETMALDIELMLERACCSRTHDVVWDPFFGSGFATRYCWAGANHASKLARLLFAFSLGFFVGKEFYSSFFEPFPWNWFEKAKTEVRNKFFLNKKTKRKSKKQASKF